MKNITIIIPVYKDWKTLNLCIESLKKYIAPQHTIMLVNDCSNEADELESKILHSIKNCSNFLYYRNPTNVGFVKTCNRAVFELDKTDNDILLLNSDTEVTSGFLEEMIEVLYLAEKHGVVCPRSNCATIYSVPVRKNTNQIISPDDSYKCYMEIRNILPRYSVMPTAIGFCMLIKRNLIKLYGLFDEIYGMGYNEENDFCMRISQYGWDVIAANKAYVFHYESKSFGEKNRVELDKENKKILLDRYPYYDFMVQSYFLRNMHSTDSFADLLCRNFYAKKRILISLYNLPPVFNGTAIFGLELLKNFTMQFKDKYDIFILTNRDGASFHNLSNLYDNIFFPDTISGTFDIAYIPSQIFHIEHLFLLSRHCLRFVFCMQDIIALRCNYILAQDWEQEAIFRQSVHFANGIVAISDFTANDTKSFFYDEFSSRNIPMKKIYHASYNNIADFSKSSLPFEHFFLVFGNVYKHKMLTEILKVLKKSEFNFIIFGATSNGNIASNIYGFKSGYKEGGFVNELFEKSTGIIFPSVYEGFGIVNLDARDFCKKIIVYNNELNNELFTKCIPDYKENVSFFNTIEEIPDLVMQIQKSQTVSKTQISPSVISRSTVDVALETEQFLSEILEAPVDLKLLQERWNFYHYLENVHRCYVQNKGTFIALCEFLIRKIKPISLLYNFVSKIKSQLSN